MVHVTRRQMITLLGGAAAWPLAAGAQQGEQMRRVGVLVNLAANDPMGQARVAAFVQGLQAAGWSDGRNVRIDTRWAAADPGNYGKYAAELMSLGPDVVLASTTAAVARLQQASRTVPIVFVSAIDPVGSGLVTSMARPGGNVTGFVIFEYALAAKWLELLKEIAPDVKRAAVLRDVAVASGIGQFAAIQGAGSVGMELSAIDLRDAQEIERAVADFAQRPNGGLIVTASQFGTNHPGPLAALAARHKLPAVYPFRYFANAGGLISYGPISWTNITAPPTTSIASCAEPCPPIFRCKRQPSTNSRSTSRPRNRWASKCLQPFSPAPTGSSNEAARVHHAARRRDRVAAGGGCAAAGDAGGRLSQQHFAWPDCAAHDSVQRGIATSRLCRGTECCDRIPLGRRAQ
jgi:putative tryptophan/tyrosine transport system substrate-binding protein